MFLEHRGNEQHIRAFLPLFEVKPFMRMLLKHNRREGTEAFAELYFQVHGCLHFRRPRVADNAAGAKRPGPEFHSAAEPSNYLLLGKKSGHVLGMFLFILDAGVLNPPFIQESPDFSSRKSWPEQAALLGIMAGVFPRLIHELMPGEKRGSESAPGIAGSGLDPNIFKGAFPQEPSVGHTIQRYASRQD